MKIHIYAREGDIDGVARELSRGILVDSVGDAHCRTPRMCAVASPKATAEIVSFLIGRGADVNAIGGDSPDSLDETVVELAVRGRDLEKIRLLLDAGADIHYGRSSGYDVLTDAVCRWPIAKDETVLSIINLLLERGAKTNGISDYGESALRVRDRAL